MSKNASAEDYETIWELGGKYPWDATPGAVTLSSTDADDNDAGPGAQIVRVSGVGVNGDALTEDMIVDGASPASSTETFLHVHRLGVIRAGSESTNIGVITATMGGDDVSVIAPFVSRQRQGTWTVPNGWKNGAILGQVILGVLESKEAVIEYTIRINFAIRADRLGECLIRSGT